MAIISTGTLSFIGDAACQYVEHKYSLRTKLKMSGNFKWNLYRSCRFGAVGMTIGIQLSIWYRILATKIFVGESFGIAMKRMCIDQFLFAPWAISYVFTLNTFIDGGNFQDALNRIKDQFIPTYKVNLMVWPAAQLINFWLIPVQYRVLMANGTALWWNTYLSYRSHVNITTNSIS